MFQLTQNLRDGRMELMDVPIPACGSGEVLVEVAFSAVSAGTEGRTVRDARAGLIAKARSRKEEVEKVINTARQQGVSRTVKMVREKLESPSTLGYSCSGKVLAVGHTVRNFKPGDLVACAGPSAAHAEVVSVPELLCASIENEERLDSAAFTTLGAIGLQGIRKAELNVGETAVVIGLGIVGQLTLQMLQLAGVKAIGIDVDEAMCHIAQKGSEALIIERNSPHLMSAVEHATDGNGVDAVLICAGTTSTDPVDLAGELCRPLGKVVIVGNVPTGFKRKNYYKKELDLRMSMSYGPGRYDSSYEEKGLDYPYGYVRWTEGRNIQTVGNWLDKGDINPGPIITHTVDFRSAPEAYDVILDDKTITCGILLKYQGQPDLSRRKEIRPPSTENLETPSVGFIGVGSFAKNFLLPNLSEDVKLTWAITTRSVPVHYSAQRFGFHFAGTDPQDLLNDKATNAVVIATRHNTHAEYVRDALKASRHVYVEKPLCLYEEELDMIASAWRESGKMLMIGFNRRFAPMVSYLQEQLLTDVPRHIRYRINSPALPKDHWALDPEVGGGRIKGELCHFLDLCEYLCPGKIRSLSAAGLPGVPEPDSFSVQMRMSCGSTAVIDYIGNGNKLLPKEEVEVHCEGRAVLIEDFNKITVFGKKKSTIKKKVQDKGHLKEMTAFEEALKTGGPSPIEFGDIYRITSSTFAVLESISKGGESISPREYHG